MDLAHGLDAVAQPRGAFEVQRLGGRVHVLGELRLHVAALAGQEAFGLAHQFGIAGFVDAPDARRAAALDLEQQAGPGAASNTESEQERSRKARCSVLSVRLTAPALAKGPK